MPSPDDLVESRAARRAALPPITYPPVLPVSQKREDILAAIRDNQVVIVAGETGSGKTTQLPKICLDLGRGVNGMIGHTQPRRLAARTVAERIAEELGSELGDAVGYQVRFTDRVGDGTLVKLMTDGILLTEMQRDRDLRAYDTLIIDEAHERSLNIDFILGYLTQLLPRRPDLKLIITSATIDPERFANHFGGPIVEVSGRTYPVEVRYRPIVDPDDPEADPDRDQVSAICDAVDELAAEGPGDVLVFLSGEREIRDTADALAKRQEGLLRPAEILPLFARLSNAEQHRVFQPHAGRRVVLATNVAETSLTVPGIKYVIDPGTARVSRYSHRLKVQRLPIEPVSQASANQRKGRCGRTSDGICIRLYSEEDFEARPEFTEPEILRTNLASVVLQMTALGLGEIAAFPFLEPPDSRQVTDGVRLLHELGALDPSHSADGALRAGGRRRLTKLGRQLARLPIDPRLGRMVLEADRNGCVRDVLVIAAALSIQDPRERPVEKQAQATQQHARFVDKDSDFIGYLNLWNYLREKQRELSSSQFRRMCKAEYLNYLRIREWQDLESQLRSVARSLGIRPNDQEAAPQHIHTSLLAGLLSHIGLKDTDKNEYLGARGAKFAVFPGSALFKKPPRWIVAAELVETSRLWGRIAARIEPEWVEPLAQHVVKRTYSEPHWEKDQGAVMAYEKVTLYGVPIVASRKINYGRIEPELSRDLFIRHALVEGDWQTHHKFFHANRKLLDAVGELEDKARRRDIVVDDETLFDFYDKRVGEEAVSARHFDTWWKRVRADQPELLNFERSMLVHEGVDVKESDYPDTWTRGDLRLRLTYQFEPGTEADGVTVHIPLRVLNRIEPEGFDWQIPGLREQLATALIRSLPKAIRRTLVPAPDVARAALARLEPFAEPLLSGLERELRSLTGTVIPRDAWDFERVPDHLRMTFRVEDDKRRPLGEGKDLDALKERLAPKTRAALSAAAESIERAGLRDWDIKELPRSFERGKLLAFPALVDEGDTVAIRMFGTEDEQRRAHWAGVRRLLTINVPSPMKYIVGRLTNQQKLTLSHNPHGGVPKLLDDCVGCALDRIIADGGGPPWDADAYRKLYDRARAELSDGFVQVVEEVERILGAAYDAERRASGRISPVLLPAMTDVRSQLGRLVYPGFVTDTGWSRLPHLLRYLRAIGRRLDKLPENPGRDRDLMSRFDVVADEYEDVLDRLPPARHHADDVREIHWMLEELRVSFFAQELRTPYPVSEKRILRALAQLE